MISLICCLSLVPARGRNIDTDDDSPMDPAGLWEAKDRQAALEMLDSLPEDEYSQYQKVRILFMAGDHTVAAVGANEYLYRWPDSPLSLSCRWIVAASVKKMGFYNDAAKRFSRLAEEDSLLSDIAWAQAADCYRLSGKGGLAGAIIDSLRRFQAGFESDVALYDSLMTDSVRTLPQVVPQTRNRRLGLIAREINRGRYRQAMSQLEKFIKNNPRSQFLGQAQYLIGLCWEKQGQLDRAAQAYLLTDQRQPASAYSDDALFRAGWCRYKMNDKNGCWEIWGTLEKRQPHSELMPAVKYWRYRLAKEDNDSALADSIGRNLLQEHPYNYYWWRLRAGLGALVPQDSTAAPDTAPSGLNSHVRQDYSWWLAGHQQYRQAMRLIDIGLLDEARFIADRLRKAAANDALALFHLALIYHRLGQDPLAIDYARLAQRLWLGPRPRELYEILYPRRYIYTVRKTARINGLEPALVLSVMRQESKFVSNARSRAGARGLMQIMPRTGRRLMGRRIRPDTLYHPETSIFYGTKFLSRLIDRFGGSVVRALGAYNAGPARMDAWLRSPRCRQDEDFLIEEIHISETRNYIKRVMEGYYIYSWLLGRHE